jgi:hypothetical protein
MPAGRPLLFKTVEELKQAIDGYFNSCWSIENGVRKQTRPYTITGLAVHLDTSRQTLINYEDRGEFFDAIKKAKDRIENYTEEQLYRTTQVTGVIFNLKNNYEWRDKSEQDVTSGGEKLQGVVILPKKDEGTLETPDQTGISA